MDGAEDLAHAQAMVLGQHELGQQVPRMRGDDGDAEDLVLPRSGQDLDKAAGLCLGQRPVQAAQIMDGDLMANAFPFCLQ